MANHNRVIQFAAGYATAWLIAVPSVESPPVQEDSPPVQDEGSADVVGDLISTGLPKWILGSSTVALDSPPGRPRHDLPAELRST